MVKLKADLVTAGKDHRLAWADDLTVAMTPMMFAFMDINVRLSIKQPERDPQIISSGIDMDDTTTISLYFKNGHYDLIDSSRSVCI